MTPNQLRTLEIIWRSDVTCIQDNVARWFYQTSTEVPQPHLTPCSVCQQYLGHTGFALSSEGLRIACYGCSYSGTFLWGHITFSYIANLVYGMVLTHG